MLNGSCQRRQKFGFTLVELLVVISIIALLLSILMPALSKVRDQARRTICATRQRQIGLSMEFYIADYKNCFPPSMYQPFPAQNPNFWGYWHNKLADSGYMQYTLPTDEGEVEIAWCPSTRLDLIKLKGVQPDGIDYGDWTRRRKWKNGYYANYWAFVPWPEFKACVSRDKIRRLGSFAVMADSIGFMVGGPYRIGGDLFPIARIGLPHRKNTNLLFADWHIETTDSVLKVQDLMDNAQSPWDYIPRR